MYLAVELGSIDLNPVFKGALATILYFLVGTAVLILGFIVVDVLTPGKLRRLVFIDRRPNAVMLACANYIALAAVIISAITNSYSQLGQGLVGRGGVRADGRCPAGNCDSGHALRDTGQLP